MKLPKTILIIPLTIILVPSVRAESCYDDGKLTDYCKLDSKDQIGIPEASLATTVTNIVNTLGLIAGILSVIFLVLGGINYITSEGDKGKLQGAKNTITYAIIGLIISILAPVIVGFVISYSPQ